MQDTRPHKEKSAEDVAANADLKTPIDALRRLVLDLDELISNSDGIYGVFGDRTKRVAWSEFTAGGMSGWIGDALKSARDVVYDYIATTPDVDVAPSEDETKIIQSSPDYKVLASVLQMALDQAQAGKGRERHANGQSFAQQPILNIARMLEGIDGHGFQVMKKTQEAVRMFHRGRWDAAVHEMLGVIVYAAAAVVFMQEVIESIEGQPAPF